MIRFLKYILPAFFPVVLLHAGGPLPINSQLPEEVNNLRYATFVPAPYFPKIDASFTALHDGEKVLLSWKTSTEKNLDYFTVERAKDGQHFTTAVMVKACGTTLSDFDYRDTDYSPLPGVSYYRLKITDHSGHVSYSPVIPVNFQHGKDGSLVEANRRMPDTEELRKVDKKDVLVLVRDASGNEFTAKVKVTREQDEKLYAQDSQNNLGKGSYVVLASSYNALYSQRLIVR